MESFAHLRLKQLAIAFLRERGCLACAAEVRCPLSRYRVDVAGYLDTRGGSDDLIPERHEGVSRRQRGSRRRPPRTVLVECKQSRSDFFRDRRDQDRLLQSRDELLQLKSAMERDRIPRAEPELMRSASLFGGLMPETADWDYAASRLPAYRDLLRKLRKIDRLLHGETKFHLAARYHLADRLYIAAPRGMIRPRELPPGWGLLECPARALAGSDVGADLFGDSILIVRTKAPPLRAPERFRASLLRNIAVAASTTLAQRGLTPFRARSIIPTPTPHSRKGV